MCGTGVPCFSKSLNRREVKEVTLNLKSADLGLVLTWPLLSRAYQYSSYLSLRYLRTRDFKLQFYYVHGVYWSGIKTGHSGAVVSGPQAWSIHWKDSMTGGSNHLKFIHIHVWHLGRMTQRLELLNGALICGLSMWLGFLTVRKSSWVAYVVAQGSKHKCSMMRWKLPHFYDLALEVPM